MSNKLGYHYVDVEYSRPVADKRVIWDGLVPYGKVWRTGADYPTFITLKDTIAFNGEIVAPGKYALYTIPGEKEWVVILSSNTNLWGAYGYSINDDVLRLKVKPETAHHEESFLIYFSNTRSTSCDLILHWEKIKVKIALSIDITDKIILNLNGKIKAGEVQWGDYWKGAKFLHHHKQEKLLALEWIKNSVKLEQNWMNMDTYARILIWNGQKEYAIMAMEKALDICIREKEFCPYEFVYRQQIQLWLKY